MIAHRDLESVETRHKDNRYGKGATQHKGSVQASPAALALILGIPENIYCHVAERYRRRWLEESGHLFNNVDRTNLT